LAWWLDQPRAATLPGVDPALARLLALGGGAARSTDARELLGDRQLRRLLSFELLDRISGRVVGVNAMPTATAAQVRRAEVRLGRPVIACLGTAAALHGFAVRPEPAIHLTTDDGWSQRTPAGVVLHQAPPRSPVVERDGGLVTDPAETAIDVARAGPAIDVLAVLDAALRAGVTEEDLHAAADRAGRRRGVAQVRDWLPFADWRSDSAMESRQRYRILDAGLPAPDLQVVVDLGDGTFRFLDLGWHEARLGCDYDSEEFHSGAELIKDRFRHNQVTNRGWRMFYSTHRDVYRDPVPLLTQIGSGLRVAGYEFGRQRVPATDIPRPAGPAGELLHRSRLLWSAR
jgi:hypothetical protein